MLSFKALDKVEFRAEEPGKLLGVISLYREPAAPIGPAEAEGRNDHVSSHRHSGPNRVQIALPVGRLGQEVEDRPVVPHVHSMWQAQVPGIADDPSHLAGSGTQACPSDPQGCAGHIDHGNVAVTLVEQTVDEERGPSPDVDDGSLPRRRDRTDQAQSGRWFRLEPADLRGALARPYLLPVRLSIHRRSFPVAC
jgi:hypothetical protein